jgi:hypothetical protein
VRAAGSAEDRDLLVAVPYVEDSRSRGFDERLEQK